MQLGFLTETQSVYCAVRTQTLYYVVGSRGLMPPDALQTLVFSRVSTRDPSSETRNYFGRETTGNFDRKLRLPHIHFGVLLHAADMRHGTKGFTYLLKEGVLRIFFALKNPTASAGFEPENMGTKGQHATSRPPKPLSLTVIWLAFLSKLFVSEWPAGED